MTRQFARTITLVAAAIVAVAPVVNARPQSPKTEVKATVGVGLDEDGVSIPLAGGSARYYFSGRTSVEPEVIYGRYRKTDYLFVGASGTFDFRRPHADMVFRPDLSAYGGSMIVRTTSNRASAAPTSHDTQGFPAFGVGFGFKFFVNDRVFVEPELRIGVYPAIRATVSAGYVVSRRSFPTP